MSNKKFTKRSLEIFIIGILLIVFIPITFSYNVDPDKGEAVHQYISEQAGEVWIGIPHEIEDNIDLALYTSDLDSGGYNPGAGEFENILIGSGEEDTEFDATCLAEVVTALSAMYPLVAPATIIAWSMSVARPFCYHFYNPDNPEGGDYDDGWLYYESSYGRADDLWEETILPYYTGEDSNGNLHPIDQDRAYYYVGRIAHLLEDATSVPHIHEDTHIGYLEALLQQSSHYEEYTANNFDNGYYTAENLGIIGEQYSYEDLISGFDWSDIDPPSEDNIDLFRLFWYTAQKTQYFSSRHGDKNDTYYDISNNEYDLPNLWSDESPSYFPTQQQMLDDDDNNYLHTSHTADYLMPHAMKAVSGLYRLFWHTVRNELRLTIPVNPSNSYQVDSVYGGVKQDGSWFTELNVSGQDTGPIKVELTLTDNCNDDISITLTNPSGTSYQNSTIGIKKTLRISNPEQGIWNITINGNSVTEDIQEFKVSAGLISAEAGESGGSGPGGINFSSASLNYISTCDTSEVSFVMEAKEANATDPIINITNQTMYAMDTFMAALIIPNHNQWVSLPGYEVQIDPVLAQTELGRIMLDDDVDLKFGDTSVVHDMIVDVYAEWDNLLSQSSYTEVQNLQGTYPGWSYRTAIIPGTVKANGTGCKVFIVNASLDVESEVTSTYLSVTGSTQAIQDDLTSRLNTWEDFFNDKLQTEHVPAERQAVNNDPQFETIRTAYKSVALAQWFKEQSRDQVPFGDLIDSNNISTLNISFDEQYWLDQSIQFMLSVPEYNIVIRGGAVLQDADITTEGEINNETADLMNDAVVKSYIQENETVYFSTTKKPVKPDLKPIAVGFSSLTPESNEMINISVLVENEGKANATNFSVYFYYEYTYPNGYTAKRAIAEEEISSIGIGEIILVNSSFNNSELGDYNITAIIDYENDITEINELNNKISEVITVLSKDPTAIIAYPTSGYQTVAYDTTTLIGYGTDEQDDYVNDLNWSSNIDGYLGNETILTTNLSVGNHIITLTATDSDGNTATDTVAVGITSTLPPVVTINTPVNGETIIEGVIIYFDAEANDPEDGTLSGSSLIWNSSIDGLLSYGDSFTSNSLSAGTHNLTFIATDSSDTITSKSININNRRR